MGNLDLLRTPGVETVSGKEAAQTPASFPGSEHSPCEAVNTKTAKLSADSMLSEHARKASAWLRGGRMVCPALGLLSLLATFASHCTHN